MTKNGPSNSYMLYIIVQILIELDVEKRITKEQLRNTKEEKIDYGYLWYFVSLKRYVKLVGWYIDLSKEDYDKTKENKYYFDSLDSFYKKMK